jgi:chemotaxis protein CheC
MNEGGMLMGRILTETQQHVLQVIFDRGAESASLALSKWLGKEVHLSVSEVEIAELERAAELLGPPDTLVTACSMELTGRLTGWILLVFEDRSGLALVDMLLQQPLGTTTAWGEIEQSAAKETTNIVGCAYVNALAAHLPAPSSHAVATTERADEDGNELIPTPPTFFHEFAGSLLEFALMEQAVELDEVLLIRSEFKADRREENLNWTLLFVPTRESLHELIAALAVLESHRPK